LNTPLLGEMTRKQTVARISLIIAVLMRSGIEFLQAVEIAAGSINNVILREALSRGAEAVRQGQDIGPALAATSLFPPVATQVFTIGQQTGQLEPMLVRLSEEYDRQLNTLSQRFATLLEPVLIGVLSVIVGFILFATVLPILEAGNVL
jgi:type II secretory pathway component PulF